MSRPVLIGTLAASVAAAYLGLRLGMFCDGYPGLFEGLLAAADGFLPELAARPLALSASPAAAGLAFAGFLAVWCFWSAFLALPGNFRAGEEHGSARWGTPREGRAFLDSRDKANNIMLTRDYGLALSQRRFDERTYRNLNVLVIGSPGTGKSKRYVIPNILNANASFFVTDTKGSLLPETGRFLEGEGYDVRQFSTIDFSASLHYNPLFYVGSGEGIDSIVTCLYENLTPKNDKPNDPIWSNGEKMLYSAILHLIRDWIADEDYSLPGMLRLLDMARVREDDEDYISPLDLLFMEIETGMRFAPVGAACADAGGECDHAARGLRPPAAESARWAWQPSLLARKSDGARPADAGGFPDDPAVVRYRRFKAAAGKTMKSFLITCFTHLNPLENAQIKRLLAGAPGPDGRPTGRCEMALDAMGDPGQKSAVFVAVSDTDKTYHFVSSMMMWQATNLLCERALEFPGQRLPTPVHLVLDEFANIGRLPGFDNAISVTRSRNIFASLIIQSLAQLKANYTDEEATTIRDCCDTTLYLGSTNAETNEEISKRIGDETVDVRTHSRNRGAQGGGSESRQKIQRRLMDASEIEHMDVRDALVLIRAAPALRGRKCDPVRHPNWKRTASGSGEAPFDFKEYMGRGAARGTP